MIGLRVERRRFDDVIVVATMTPLWTTARAASTGPVLPGAVFRGYLRVLDGDRFRYAYMAGRGAWNIGDEAVSDGLLFEVSPRLRIDPSGIPSNGSRFREIGEAAVANDPDVFDRLREGYSQ